MRKIGQFLQRLIFYVIAAVFILNFKRLFGSGRLSFFPIVMIVAVVFLAFAWGMMQTMFAGADDSPVRKGEMPADARPVYKMPPPQRPEVDQSAEAAVKNDEPAPKKIDYKKIASDIGTEAELREIERREREELKRLDKGR